MGSMGGSLAARAPHCLWRTGENAWHRRWHARGWHVDRNPHPAARLLLLLLLLLQGALQLLMSALGRCLPLRTHVLVQVCPRPARNTPLPSFGMLICSNMY